MEEQEKSEGVGGPHIQFSGGHAEVRPRAEGPAGSHTPACLLPGPAVPTAKWWWSGVHAEQCPPSAGRFRPQGPHLGFESRSPPCGSE